MTRCSLSSVTSANNPKGPCATRGITKKPPRDGASLAGFSFQVPFSKDKQT